MFRGLYIPPLSYKFNVSFINPELRLVHLSPAHVTLTVLDHLKLT